MARLLEHTTRLNALRIIGVAAVCCLLFAGLPDRGTAQSNQMDWSVRPDLWWNQVDGLRPGLQLHGWQTGSTRQTRRELEAGIWVGTKWPEHPVSYRLYGTEPIPGWNGEYSGGALGFASTHRVGVRSHRLFLNGRWKLRHNPSHRMDIRLQYNWMRRTDPDYRYLPQRWQPEWNELLSIRMVWQSTPQGGVWNQWQLEGYQQLRGESFSGVDFQWTTRTPGLKRWGVESVLRSGWTGSDARPEFRYGVHSGQAVRQLADPFWRARGSLPEAGVESGFLRPPNGIMRGFGSYEWDLWRAGEIPLWRGHAGGEWRVWTPNPVQRLLQEIETMNHFVTFRTHLFLSTEYFWNGSKSVSDGWFHEAGPGLEWRVEIPDEHTGFRGFSIRYDLPLWATGPNQKGTIQFRHVLGIQARYDF